MILQGSVIISRERRLLTAGKQLVRLEQHVGSGGNTLRTVRRVTCTRQPRLSQICSSRTRPDPQIILAGSRHRVQGESRQRAGQRAPRSWTDYWCGRGCELGVGVDVVLQLSVNLRVEPNVDCGAIGGQVRGV